MIDPSILLPLIALLLASALVPGVRRLAVAVGALDRPGERKVHDTAMPRLGGLVVLGAVAGTLGIAALAGWLPAGTFGDGGVRWPLLACGAVTTVVLGALDDVLTLGAGRKLAVQVLAASCVVASGCVIREVPSFFSGQSVPLGALAIPVTMIWVIGVTNALNLIDGLDGLATGVSLLVTSTLALISLSIGRPDAAYVGLAFAGALAGFLFFNFNPASIFLGDSGSLLLGYTLAVLGIESAHHGTTTTFLLTPIVALGLPILDTVFAIGRRLGRALRTARPGAAGGPARIVAAVMRADREHIHHWLMAIGFTHRRAVLVLYGVCVVLNLAAILVMRAEATDVATVLGIVAVTMFLGVRALGYARLLTAAAPRPRILHALGDACGLGLAYLAAVTWGAGAPVGSPGWEQVLQAAVTTSAVMVTGLLAAGAYAPDASAARWPARRLLPVLAVGALAAAGTRWALGFPPPTVWSACLHLGLASAFLAASRQVAALREAHAPAAARRVGVPAGRLRVLHVGKFFHPARGGIETYVKTVCDGLRGHVDVQVLVANPVARTVRERVGDVPVTRVASFGQVASVALTPRLPALLGRYDVDVVHLHAPNPLAELAYLWSPLARRSRLVVTWHSDVVRQRWFGALYRPLSRRLLARADAICVATPNHVASSALLPAYADKIHLCAFGVEPDAAHADGRTVQALRARYGRRPLVLGVGRLVYYKGFELLLEAMVGLDATLVLVGDGPLRGRLEQRVAALGLRDRVQLVGEQDDVRPWFAACDVFVLPSTHRSEAFGIVQIEAMAFAKPVVSTRLGTGVEWVNRHGETGLVVPVGDVAALRDAIGWLLADPVRRTVMGARAARRVHREFTAHKAAADLLTVYRHVVGGPTTAATAPAAQPTGPSVEWGVSHVG